MKKLSVLIVFFIAAVTASAQSLNRENPYPLKAGINKGIVDSYIGTQYWYFYATPGSDQVTVRLKNPTSVFGALQNIVLTITVSDEKQTWHATKTATSNGEKATEATFAAKKIDKKTKIIISVAPPSGQLIRAGGQYEIEATGDVAFDEVKNTTDPIIRTYRFGNVAVKFLADGTVETADGFSGTWKAFDPENRIYTIIIKQVRWSLQYFPGYGLADPGDPYMVKFMEVAR